MNEKQLIDLATNAIEKIKTLEHRLAMVKEDSAIIQAFIEANGLSKAFEKSTPMSEEAWSHFANIDIACNLNSDESLDWKPFNK